MKTFVVAGHEFEDRIDAVCIRKLHNGTECGKPWWFVAEAKDTDVGQPDKAHEPNLTINELNEIRERVKLVDEMKERAWNATIGIGSGV